MRKHCLRQAEYIRFCDLWRCCKYYLYESAFSKHTSDPIPCNTPCITYTSSLTKPRGSTKVFFKTKVLRSNQNSSGLDYGNLMPFSTKFLIFRGFDLWWKQESRKIRTPASIHWQIRIWCDHSWIFSDAQH